MRTAEPLSGARRPAAAVAGPGRDSRRCSPADLGCGCGALGQGLPFAYNTDEADHFVPHAVRMFREGTLNPHYFANPPAFTYLLHGLYAIAYGGGSGVIRAFALHPAELYTLARVAAAVLGTLAVWLLYGTGARLFGRGVGLLAAAILAVAFLPVFYAHLGPQRRAHARAAHAVPAGDRGDPAQRARPRPSGRGRRAGPGLRQQVHRRDRAHTPVA